MSANDEAPYGHKTQRIPALAELDILWITAGLGCDGDTISILERADRPAGIVLRVLDQQYLDGVAVPNVALGRLLAGSDPQELGTFLHGVFSSSSAWCLSFPFK